MKTYIPGDSFKIEPVTKTIIDEYDSKTDKVIRSHQKPLNFNVVRFIDESAKSVDFTWVKNEDVIDVGDKPNLDEIKVRISQLSKLVFDGLIDKKYGLEIICDVKKFFTGKQLKDFEDFIRINRKVIDSITLVNGSSSLTKKCQYICEDETIKFSSKILNESEKEQSM